VAVRALRDALENEVAALVLKLLVDIKSQTSLATQSKSTEDGRDLHRSRLNHFSGKGR
jgi:hypothetical protein